MENTKKQTVVEWFAKELKNLIRQSELTDMKPSFFDEKEVEILKQAKEMEKERMLNAFQESRLTHPMIGFKHETFVDYYNETYK